MNGTLAAIERMRPAGRGHIINVISLAGLAAATGLVGYSASKHAAIAFSLGTAADLRRAGLGGIRISCVCPDGVWTPMIADRLDDPNDALSFSGVMLMPEQVAEHVDRLLDKPKAVLTIPRWRGRFARFFDRHPDLSLRADAAPDARRAPAPAGFQEEGRVGQVASERPAEGTARPGDPRRALPHRAGPMPLSGWVRYPAAWLRARTRPDSRASLDRARLDRLAAPADPVRVVDPRARGRKVDRLVRAPGGAGDQPRGQRVLALIDPPAARRGRSDNADLRLRPVEDFPSEIASLPDDAFDLVVVDFLEAPTVTRIDCLDPAMHKVRPGGYLLLDDSDRPGYAEAFELLAGWRCPQVRRRQGRVAARPARPASSAGNQMEEAPLPGPLP